MSSLIFLPIALRSVSARPSEKPAIRTAMRITCSWYTMTPYVSARISSSSGKM